MATAAQDSPERLPLYLDAQATTMLDPRVLDAMLPYLTHQYGNPHSRTHTYGWESERAMEVARQVRNCWKILRSCCNFRFQFTEKKIQDPVVILGEELL